jgi:hypothetical protein
MWVDDLDGSGWPTLSYSFYDGLNTMVDSVRMDICGIQSCGGLTIVPTMVTADYTITSVDQYIYVDASAAGHNIALPKASSSYGRVLWIFKTDASANPVTLVPFSGDKINGSTSSKTITTQYGGVKMVVITNDIWVASALPPA